MNLLPTFGFKGHILPIIDKNDKFYVFIKNETDSNILLNLISVDVNKFVYIDKFSTKIISCGSLKSNTHLKIFYMGNELFDFQAIHIDKSSLLLYSDFIIKNCDESATTFSVTYVNGVKIQSTTSKPQHFYLKVVDKDNDEIIHEDNLISGDIYTLKKDYFINYDISILDIHGQKIHGNSLNLNKKSVLITLDTKELGTTLAWIPYVEEFRKRHDCEVLCLTNWNHLFKSQYSNIKFVSPLETVEESKIYASYRIQNNSDVNSSTQVLLDDHRDLSIQQIASKTLGFKNHIEIKPLVILNSFQRTIKEDYVVLSISSDLKAKLWNYVGGWQQIVDYLESKGLKVVLLQKEKSEILNNIINLSGVEDIFKYIEILSNCKFFVGTSSDLSWLAWALNKNVVMINGFNLPSVEFTSNNYRVINTSVCHGCWNDREYKFDKSNWLWCPRKRGFECSTSITTEMVINKINEIIQQRPM